MERVTLERFEGTDKYRDKPSGYVLYSSIIQPVYELQS